MSQSFAALGVSAPVVEVLDRLGITSPFAIQNARPPATPSPASTSSPRRPTGSGKTLAFGIPMIERTAGADGHPSALVLVPTRELASQIVDELQPLAAARDLRIAAVYGGTSVGGQAKKARGAEILVATPGRLHDLLERRLVSLGSVRVLVLDEADRMLDMGFRPQVDRILAQVPQNRQTMLFSATLDGPVAELARTYTDNASRFTHRRPGRDRRPATSGTSSSRSPPRTSSSASSSSSAGARARARLRPHEARRRQARAEARARPRRARCGHAREHVPERARALAARSSSRAASRR